MKRLYIFSKAGCPFCSLLKMELSKRAIRYTEVDLTDDSLRADFYERTGLKSVPQGFISETEEAMTALDGIAIGGWSEISGNWQVLDGVT